MYLVIAGPAHQFMRRGFALQCSLVLGSELWEDKFGSLLGLVKGLILDVWELRRVRLYGDIPSVQKTQFQIASGELQGVACGRGELRCLGGETFVNGSTHCSGCVVYGPSAMAAS